MGVLTCYLRMQKRIAGNFLRENRSHAVLALMGGLAVALLVAQVARHTLNEMTRTLAQTGAEGFEQWMRTTLFYPFVFGCLLYALTVAPAFFHASQIVEIERLRHLPISSPGLFAMKCVDLTAAVGAMVLTPSFMVLALFAYRHRVIPAYLAVEVGISLFLLLAMAAFGVIILTLTAAALLPRRLFTGRALAALAVGVIAAGIWTGWQLVAAHERHLVGFMFWVPSTWVARLVGAHLANDLAVSLQCFSLLLAVAAGMGYLAYLCYRDLYLARWTEVQAKLHTASHHRGRLERWAERVFVGTLRLASVPVRAVAFKDLRAYARDTTFQFALFAQLVLSVGMQPPLIAVVGRVVAGKIFLFFLVLILHEIAFLGMSSIGIEGEGGGALAGQPLSARSVLLGKTLAVFALNLLVVVIGIFTMFCFYPPATWIRALQQFGGGLVLGTVVALFLAAMSVCTGATFPKFGSKNQLMSISLFGVGVFFLLAAGFGGTIAAALAGFQAYGWRIYYAYLLAIFIWTAAGWFLWKEAEGSLDRILVGRP